MRDITGLVLVVAGIAFVYLALLHRRRVINERNDALARGASTEPPRLHASLEIIAEVVPSMVITLLAILAASITFAFFVLNTNGTFSLFDLGGFLFALVGYGYWLIVKTRYRSLSTSASTYEKHPRVVA